jgi:hypothetical protein
MVLREKLKETKMTKLDTVTNYITKITQVHDQLAVVGEFVSNELMRTTMNGFSKPWAPFIKGIIAREKLPYFDSLWDDFIYEEIQGESLASQQVGDDENLALASQARGRGNTFGESTSHVGKKNYLSKENDFLPTRVATMLHNV